MDSAKPFKTHDELLDLLESRGIDFFLHQKAVVLLKRDFNALDTII